MGRLYPIGQHIRIDDDDGHRIWSSDGRPVNLLPQVNWLSQSLTVAYADWIKRNAYNFLLSPGSSCLSWSTILPGEWGPDQPAPRNLPDQVIGTVPAGVNYIDVRVTLNRTKNPTNFQGFPVANCLPTQQTHLPGGSCLCERTPIWQRSFDITLSGTNIILRRRQSVYGGPNGITWAPNNQVYTTSGGKQEGMTHGGGSGSATAHLGAPLQGKNVVGGINKERGADNACSLVDNTNFSSIWTGSVLIRPGYAATV